MNYLSIRWKIILLAGMVLGLTSVLFVWQQYQLQLGEFAFNQARFRERTQLVADQLFHSQAERMQMLGNLLVELPDVRADMLNKRGDRFARTVDAISTELSFGQGITSVVFHDAGQKPLASWGDSSYSDSLIPLVRLAASSEKPQTRVLCTQACVYQTVVPVSHMGHTIGTIALVSNLESILNDLHRLSDSDVAVLHGKEPDEHLPLAGMRLVSASGGMAVRDILKAARHGFWQDGRFQLEHAGQVHQVVLISIPLTEDNYFAIVSDVTGQVELIDLKAKNSFLRGALVLAFAMLLLYFMLRPTMRRIQHVSQTLPLLGEEEFARVRENYAARPQGGGADGKWTDEVDELERLALALAVRLELLRNESILHTDSLKDQAEQLKNERDFISGLLDTAPVLILSYGQDGRIQMANACALQICGRAEVVGEDYAALFLGVSGQRFTVEMSEMKPGVVSHTESVIQQNNENIRNVLWFHSMLSVGMAQTPTWLSVGMDITEHRKNEAKIHDLAFYDPLTKLPNRRMLIESMRHAIASSARKQIYGALVFIDMDHFKAINDSQGQQMGDQVLIEVARRLRGNVREFDTVTHLAGDEFVVLLDELNENMERAAAQARLIVEKLRSAISMPCLLKGHTCHLTASAGISLFSGDEIAADELLRHANIAMSHAKTSGRNTLHFFDPLMQVGLEARASLEADLYDALEKNQFQLFYQVQVNAIGQPLGAEVLLRWFHPERGMVSPLHFIPLAEESTLILPIGLWVLETACAQIREWEADKETCQLQLAVNVSARQFHQPDFVEQVLRTLETSGANPARLKLELTESLVLKDVTDTIAKMQQLKKHGVHFSIDDFGTAYSSLSYLTQLPIDQLKIDQSFVRNLGVKSSDAIIVQTIINMARNLGMEVIAEGVETLAQREFLEQADCLAYQGYLYSKPLALDAFTVYLSELE
ncbi:MAG: EAL domain-containing protein [Proteobacteria bacterium]|nr:EAL domain-containing protein [Pseudomonadota bacterium]